MEKAWYISYCICNGLCEEHTIDKIKGLVIIKTNPLNIVVMHAKQNNIILIGLFLQWELGFKAYSNVTIKLLLKIDNKLFNIMIHVALLILIPKVSYHNQTKKTFGNQSKN